MEAIQAIAPPQESRGQSPDARDRAEVKFRPMRTAVARAASVADIAPWALAAVEELRLAGERLAQVRPEARIAIEKIEDACRNLRVVWEKEIGGHK